MKIIEKESKSIISKSNLPASDFVINPYTGCTHNCIYCYAEFMKRFCKIQMEWGEFIVVKDFKMKKIPSNQYKNKTILISSVTDAYQPVEKKYEKMKEILPSFIQTDANIEILTKSSLVLRDLNLIKKINNIKVGISLNTLDDQFRKIIEPGASPISKRLDALSSIRNEGIKNYLFISPIFPEITDIEQILQETNHFVDYYLCENLNLRGSYKNKVLSMINEYYPEHKDLYLRIYTNKQENKAYWGNYEKEINDLSHKYNKKMKIFFNHI